jgi:hypothetical protein
MTTQKQNLTPYPTLFLFQKEENLSNPPQCQQRQPTSTKTLLHDQPLPTENITATAKCRLTTENVATNAKSLSEKTVTDVGLCTSLKTTTYDKKYYCYSKMQINNRKCCNECKIVFGENDDTSLKTLDCRLDKMFDSREATHAFNVLRVKMEKDYKTKQLKAENNDNQMYFDTRDNYISAEDIRAKYKQICNSKEYLEAKKSLLLKTNKKYILV